MGTNYYLREREPYETIVTHRGGADGPVTGVETRHRSCHLCKLSAGWNPTIACDPESTIPGARFESFRAMMAFIRAHAGSCMIHDEYADEDEWGNPMYEEITPDEFELRVREWRGGAEHTDARRDQEGFEFEYRYFS